jgi:hypothetical protein
MHVKGGGLVKEEVDGGAPVVKKKEDGEGVREVICYAVWACIQRGQLCWRATRAKVVNLYVFSLSCAKSVVATGKMLSREA